jgi:FkbM family methyltransferase
MVFNTGLIARYRRLRGYPTACEFPRPEVIDGVEFYDNHGVLLPVLPDVFSEPVIATIKNGVYEAHEATELDTLIEPGEIVLEIGAGCGFISTCCAKNPHTSAVFCVEANPELIHVIELTHRVNHVTATIFNEIPAQEDGEAEFFVHRDFWGSGTHSFLGSAIKVRTTSFQKRLDEVRPTMLIVDIEGGEAALFEGASLAGVSKIMLELHQPTIGGHGVKRVFDLLSAQGYHYDVPHSTHSVVTFLHVDRPS